MNRYALFALYIFAIGFLVACQTPAAPLPVPAVVPTLQPIATLAPTPTILVPTPAATRDAKTIPLIPRQVLFGNPDKTTVRLSRDGSKISFLAPVNGVLNVWVAPINDPAAAKPVTNDTGRGIRSYSWALTHNHILYIQDVGGDENFQLFIVDLTTGQNRALVAAKGVRVGIQRVSDKFPREILVSTNERDKRLFDIFRVNIDTGEKSLVLQNEGFAGFVTDDNYEVRFAERVTSDGGYELLKRTNQGAWQTFAKIGLEDESTTFPAGFDATGKILYMVDSRGRNTSALTSINLDTGVQVLFAANSLADVSNVLLHPTQRTVQAVAFNYDRQRWQFLDDAIAADFAYLKTVADGEIGINSRSLDDNRWIVTFMLDNGPVRYYFYDRAAKSAKFLFTNRKALEELPLAKMQPVMIKSRDGLELVSYLTLPVDAGARPAKPLPLVLSVHGGPWSRDEWGYDSTHQWLANRGYAILSVNYRGSTGFGKAFLNAANLEWARKMHEDLIDAVNWAVKEGIADAGKICIMGGSYGGYATLVGVTFTPDVFACGVDIVGPSSLVTLLNNPPPYWETSADVMKKRVGDWTTEEGRAFLTQRSPLTFVDRITKPLLIGQGANDPRVKQAEADQIVRAMQAKKIPVTYVLYPDEGHGFARPPNRLSFNAVTEIFLAKILGGRYEPIGDDLKGSTITVSVGAELIVGLADALGKK